jgi:capsule polysaccharide export protein KpsE/RkpR
MSDLEESLSTLNNQLDVQRAEMTLMRKALEDTLERLESSEAPAYDEEFGNVYQSIQSLAEQLGALKNAPLLSQPQHILDRIERASESKIKTAIQALEDAKREADQKNKELAILLDSAHERSVQNKLMAVVFGIGLAFGSALIFVAGELGR